MKSFLLKRVSNASRTNALFLWGVDSLISDLLGSDTSGSLSAGMVVRLRSCSISCGKTRFDHAFPGKPPPVRKQMALRKLLRNCLNGYHGLIPGMRRRDFRHIRERIESLKPLRYPNGRL